MEDHTQTPFDRLLSILRRLRAPDGCAWDRTQTPHTMRDNLIEEAYECVSAISSGDSLNLREELGDIFMIICLVALMKEEEGVFSVSDVLDDVCAKLVRRHPHVFSDAKVDTVHGIVAQWDRIKATEKKKPESSLEGVPSSLPPLERAAKIQEKVSKVGFDWEGPAPVWLKLDEEVKELAEAEKTGDARRIEDELGDILFTVVNLSRLMGIDPGLALHGTNEKFMRRFLEVEKRLRQSGVAPREAGLVRMDEVWNQVKADEKSSK